MFKLSVLVLSVFLGHASSALAAIVQPLQQYKIRVDVPITFSDFIPEDNIDAPLASIINQTHCYFNACVWQGDNRGFAPPATTFRARQKVTLAPADPATPLGVRAGTAANDVQPTALYDKATSLGADSKITQQAKNDTNLNDNALKIAEETADKSSMQIGTIRINSAGMRADLSGDVSNPLPLFSCNITWNLSVAVDRTVSPSIQISGTRGRYPAYDMSVGVQYFKIFEPPVGSTALSLCLPTVATSIGADLE